MAFLLLGRTADDTLKLLSDRVFDSRQSALAALSEITADPAFDSWDDEVVLIDIELGTPVLLVRPVAPASDVVAPQEPEPAMFAAIADEEPVVAEAEKEAAAQEPEAAPAVVADTVPEEPVAVVDIDEVARTLIAEVVADNAGASVDDFEPHAVSLLDELSVETEQERDSALLEALARTTVQMEADGIVAPASISAPEQVPVEEPLQEVADATEIPQEQPAEVDSSEHTDGELPPAEELATETQPEELEPMVPADDEAVVIAETPLESQPEPEPLGAVTTEVEAPEPESEVGEEERTDEPVAETPAEEPAEPPAPAPASPVWPWDVSEDEPAAEAEAPTEEPAPSPSLGGVILEGLEEPAIDAGGSLIASTIDDDGLAAARPVILGAYGERAVDVEIDDEETVGPIPESVPETEAEGEAEKADDSDFIILGDGSEAPDPQTPDVTTEDSPLSSYTCNDCVYVETCPNKDQRRPEDCGSFQWK